MIRREWKSLLRDAMRLAFPVMLEEALGTAVGYVDAAMVGRLGASASAAVGMTATVTWLVNAPLWAMGVAVMAVISRAMGAGDRDTARRAGAQSVWLALMLGIGISVATTLAGPHLPRWMGAEESLCAEASAYFMIVCAPMVFRAFLVIFGFVLRAAHEVRIPMLVNIGVNLLNCALDYWMIFGLGLGVRGAAIATAISFSLGGMVMLFVLLKHPEVTPRGQPMRPDRRMFAAFGRIGGPAALTRMGTCLGHVVFASQVTRLGTTALAAHTLALTSEEAFYIPGYGRQTAVATLCGNALGAQDEQRLRDTAGLMCVASGLLMTVTGAILFLIPGQMMGLFTRDPQVIALGADVLRLVAVSEPVYGVGIILDGVFDGIGDTRTPLVCSVSTMWGIRILLTWICVVCFGLGLHAVWLCMVANNVTKTLLEGAIFLHGGWKRRVGLALGKEEA